MIILNYKLCPNQEFQGPPGYYDHQKPFYNYDYHHHPQVSSGYPGYASPKFDHMESNDVPYYFPPSHHKSRNQHDHIYHIYHHYHSDPKFVNKYDQKWKRSLSRRNRAHRGERRTIYQPNRKLHTITHYVPH